MGRECGVNVTGHRLAGEARERALDLGDVAVPGRRVRLDAALDLAHVRRSVGLAPGARDAGLAVDRDGRVEQARLGQRRERERSPPSRSSRDSRSAASRARPGGTARSARRPRPGSSRKSEPRSTTGVPARAIASPNSWLAPWGRQRKATSQRASSSGRERVEALGAGLRGAQREPRVARRSGARAPGRHSPTRPRCLRSARAQPRRARKAGSSGSPWLHDYTGLLQIHAAPSSGRQGASPCSSMPVDVVLAPTPRAAAGSAGAASARRGEPAAPRLPAR